MRRSLLKGLSLVFSRWKGHCEKEGDTRPDSRRIAQESHRAPSEQLGANRNHSEKDWLYVGNDEEGTPILLDKTRIVPQADSTLVRVWLRHVPAESSHSFEQAGRYLKETGHDLKSLHHLEQLVELDLHRGLIADLVLSFLDRNGRLIEQVQFNEKTLRPFANEPIYSAIKEMVIRLSARPQHPPQPPASAEPSIDERIELKLQEINSALDAFDKYDD